MEQQNKQPFFTKRNGIRLLAVVVFLIIIYMLTANNYRFYKQTILKVTKTVNSSLNYKEGVNGNKEQCFSQKITGVIKNGKDKGKTITFEQEYSYSEVLSEKYKPGDRLFIHEKENGDITVSNEKRDMYLVTLAAVLVIALLFVSKKQGFLTIVSLISNIAAFYICLKYLSLNQFVDTIWIGLVLFFCVITLLLVSGFHKKTLGAILSSLITVACICLLYYFTVNKSDDISYEMMPYVYGPLPLKKIYMISVIFGSLGAIMDVAITMNSSVCELIAKTEHLTVKKLIHSIQEIGYDIMGTMLNVMFFSYISSSLPIIILKINSGFGLGVIYRYEYIFDVVRFLLASIGIILTIPVSGVIATLLFWKGLRKNQ